MPLPWFRRIEQSNNRFPAIGCAGALDGAQWDGGMTTQELLDGTVHKLPADFRRAIESDATAKSLWADITPLARNEWICWVISAKHEATRRRRIDVGIDKMRGGMRRPCCWAGCPHR